MHCMVQTPLPITCVEMIPLQRVDSEECIFGLGAVSVTIKCAAGTPRMHENAINNYLVNEAKQDCS